MYTVVAAFPRELALQRNGGVVRWQNREVFSGSLQECQQYNVNALRTIGAVWIEKDSTFVSALRDGPDEIEENIAAVLGI
jgi:hypothetical protein